jgi:NAD(P)-dependent dehydrogenase (short-subunit alcohol dehydrogenase family)
MSRVPALRRSEVRSPPVHQEVGANGPGFPTPTIRRALAASEAVKQVGGRPYLVKADAGTPEGCAAMAAAAAGVTDRLDQVVHCAVDAYGSSALAADPARFARAVSTNGTSLLFLVQAALPLLRRGSSVTYLTSRGGRIVVPKYAAVGVAKALAESLMSYLAVELAELAPSGVRINAVALAIVETDTARTLFGAEAAGLVRAAGSHNPSGRGVTDADYTNLVRWLASPEAEFFLIHGGSEFWTSRGAIDDGRETYGACQNLTRPVAAPSGSSHIHQCWRPSRVRICAPVRLATSKTSCGGTYGSSVAWINSAGRRGAVASSSASSLMAGCAAER